MSYAQMHITIEQKLRETFFFFWGGGSVDISFPSTPLNFGGTCSRPRDRRPSSVLRQAPPQIQ